MGKTVQVGRRQTQRTILVGGAGLLVASGSLYLSSGPFTSEPWYWNFGAFPVGAEGQFENVGAYRELFRLLLTTVLFIIVHCSLFRRNSGFAAPSNSIVSWLYCGPEGTMSKKVRIAVWTVLAALAINHLIVGPILLQKAFTELPDLGAAGFSAKWSWRAYWVPYLLYLPYSVIQFGVIALSAWMALLRSASRDRGWFDRYLDDRRSASMGEIETPTQMETWTILAGSRRMAMDSELQDLMRPYASIIVCVAIVLFAELYFGLIETLSCPVQVITRIVAWMFIVVATVYFAVSLHRRSSEIASLEYDNLSQHLQVALNRNWNEASKELDLQMRGAKTSQLQHMRQFFEVVRSRAFVVPVVVIIFTSILGVLVKQDAADNRKVKDVINRLAPPGVDFVALRIIERLDESSSQGIANDPWGYRACFGDKTSACDVRLWAGANGISTLLTKSATCSTPEE